MPLTSTDSLLYLPLADATVITFLAPSLACWACSFLINEPFTRMEQMAAYVSLFGVVLIARPMSLFAALSHSDKAVPAASGDGDSVPSNITAGEPSRLASDYDSVTPTQRATAVGIAMLGVLGAAGAYTTIRWIGKRAHPLISVNYFATWCTIVSIVAMFAIPDVGFLLPRYFRDWCYLIFLGVCGFVMVSSLSSSPTDLTDVRSNFYSQPASSMKSRPARRTWYTCRCCSRSLSTNSYGVRRPARCR
jgi:drug/metabolite transporter (DMT)-like permease